MSLYDDLEDCEGFEKDHYKGKTTTAARARLCGQCQHFKMQNMYMTSIRCKLEIRPTAEQDPKTHEWKASCPKFVKSDR